MVRPASASLWPPFRRESLPSAARCWHSAERPPSPLVSLHLAIIPSTPSTPQPAWVPMKDQKPNKPKKPKKPKALCHGTSHAMDHGRYRAAPLPRHCAVSCSHTASKAERLIVPHARELPRLPLPSPLSGASSTSVTSGSRAANQASWRTVGAPDR